MRWVRLLQVNGLQSALWLEDDKMSGLVSNLQDWGVCIPIQDCWVAACSLLMECYVNILSFICCVASHSVIKQANR